MMKGHDPAVSGRLRGDQRLLMQSAKKRDYDICPVGNYKGHAWSDIPAKELRWMYEKFEDDGSGLIETIEHELSQRVDR